MKKIFDNKIIVNSPIEDVKVYLINPLNFVYWNYAVEKIIKLDDNNYTLYRDYEFGKEKENIEIIPTAKNSIEYKMTGGRINYHMKFTLMEISENETGLEEIVYEYSNNFLIKNLTKISKSYLQTAFNKNLYKLKDILESKI